jgi:DNA-binding transcriptional MerR regulator
VIVTVITVTVCVGSVYSVDLTIDALARRSGVPARTIREYQAMGLLPRPSKRGRVGIYAPSHLARLRSIARLQDRGYSLAGIRDLFASWSQGADLGEVLGLEPDELVHVDEPGAQCTLEQLAALLPALVPAKLDRLTATGAVQDAGDGVFCVPSPSLLQLARDALAAGYGGDAVLDLLAAVGRAADTVADAVVAALADQPPWADPDALARLAGRARGLLAHGTGRMTVHSLGRRLGIADEATAHDGVRRLLGVDAR